MNETGLHDWEKTGLVSGLDEDVVDICSFMLEEAYDFLTSNRNELSEEVIDQFLPTVRLIFDLNGEEYSSLDHSDLSNIISDTVVDYIPKEYPFEKEAVMFRSAKEYINKN